MVDNRLEDEYVQLLRRDGLALEWRSLRRHPVQQAWPTDEGGKSFGALMADPRAGDVQSITAALNVMAVELEGAIHRMGRDRYLDKEIFVGEYPHRTFNAQASPVSGGILILLNSGCFFLVTRITRILAAIHQHTNMLETRSTSRGGIHETQTAASLERGYDPELYAPARLRRELVNAIRDYLDGTTETSSRFSSEYPIRFDEEGYIGALLRDHIEKFIIAHEYGHVMGGHFHYPGKMLPESNDPLSDPLWLRTSREHEIEADAWAQETLFGQTFDRWNDAPIPMRRWFIQLDRRCRVAGIYLFFAVERLLQYVDRNVLGKKAIRERPSTHPSSQDRLKELDPSLRIVFDSPMDYYFADTMPRFLKRESLKLTSILREEM